MSTFAELMDEQEKSEPVCLDCGGIPADHFDGQCLGNIVERHFIRMGKTAGDCMKTGRQVSPVECQTCTIKAKCEAIRKDQDLADNLKSYWANLNNGSAGGVGSDE